MLIGVHPILVIKHHQTLSNRGSHLSTHPLCNLLIHPHQLYLNNFNSMFHSLTLLSLWKIATTSSKYVISGMIYNFKVVIDVNGSGLTSELHKQILVITSAVIAKNHHHYFTKTCIQAQVALISLPSPRWRRCSSHLYMHLLQVCWGLVTFNSC